MGVPAFFRWLTKKYPQIIVYCTEEMYIDGNTVDTSKPNPNGVEFDNLYLDMNGIIHPCTHPENKPAPTNEDEMMIAIFECIDRLFSIVRPRKLLYMAIDGVAPRAKMNQQRSRRFRASKESLEKSESIKKVREKLLAEGYILPPEKQNHFDSNCITPGTPFMARLSDCLNFYIQSKLNGPDPGWKNIKIILSDASVPGEGEHKIMDYIRRQRGQPDHDPNTRHCLCGADADLIMLGLATHEPYFTIIREEFVYNNTPKCDVCGNSGHEMKDCKGIGDDGPTSIPLKKDTQEGYIFVNLYVLKEYLETDLALPNISFTYDFERVIDDWVFLCFFVGNDFLPHLPSMEIRENAIDRLVNIYKRTMMKSKGYLTDSGEVFLDRVQLILSDLSHQEDEIFRKRKNFEDNMKLRNLARKELEWTQKNGKIPMPPSEDEPEPIDTIQLYQPGYKARYYSEKFRVSLDNIQSEKCKVTECYVQGLCWVLKYYYQGCCSWEWFYPYHYAPFASDFDQIWHLNIVFPTNTKPFSPLEQLMGVFPAASASHIPSPWAKLMTDPKSTIRDFYPDDFKIDLNGKRYAWQGVALLPFVDAARLKEATRKLQHRLTEEEKERNTTGSDRLYVGKASICFESLYKLKGSSSQSGFPFSGEGMRGLVFIIEKEFYQGKSLLSPVKGLSGIQDNTAICVRFRDPQYPKEYKFLANKLPSAEVPEKILIRNRPQDWNKAHPRPFIGMTQSTQKATLNSASHRMLEFFSGSSFKQNPYSRDGTQSMEHWKGRYQEEQGRRGRGGPVRSSSMNIRPTAPYHRVRSGHQPRGSWMRQNF